MKWTKPVKDLSWVTWRTRVRFSPAPPIQASGAPKALLMPMKKTPVSFQGERNSPHAVNRGVVEGSNRNPYAVVETAPTRKPSRRSSLGRRHQLGDPYSLYGSEAENPWPCVAAQPVSDTG